MKMNEYTGMDLKYLRRKHVFCNISDPKPFFMLDLDPTREGSRQSKTKWSIFQMKLDKVSELAAETED